jgi:hypothetical protein
MRWCDFPRSTNHERCRKHDSLGGTSVAIKAAKEKVGGRGSESGDVLNYQRDAGFDQVDEWNIVEAHECHIALSVCCSQGANPFS